jgi:hypothetical protein
MSRARVFSVSILFMALLALPFPASAGDMDTSGLGTAGISSTVVISGSLVGGIITTSSGRNSAQFLRDNAVEMHFSLATGKGSVIAELALMNQVNSVNLAHFGRAMRSHRRKLLALANPMRLTPERAQRFLARVAQIANSIRSPKI